MTTAVIFDCDGVLVDSELISNTVLARLLTEAGIAMTYEDCMRDFRGRSLESVVTIMRARPGPPPPADLAERYYAEVETVFARELDPVPGVVAALDRIVLPSCVASSGPHHKMAVTLRKVGLWERFEGRIFSAREVAAGKPAPDLFLHAAQRMGFEPATTAVVEDSLPGVHAAVAAGMRALAFTRHAGAAEMEAAGGETFADMAELPGMLAS
ncbi:MAG: HAD family hydrolase [Solirubrobacteraceae bacterium]